MTRKLIIAICLSAAALLLDTPKTSAADLTIHIDNIKKSSGSILIGIYDSAENFLKPNGMVARMKLDANVEGVRYTFQDLPVGQYAVSVFHDEDGDNKLKTNFMGIPREPIGMSRDAKGNFGPPQFSDAVFELQEAGTGITVTLD